MERRYISDYFRLIRWENLLFLGILIWVLEKWVCAPVLVSGGFYEAMVVHGAIDWRIGMYRSWRIRYQ